MRTVRSIRFIYRLRFYSNLLYETHCIAMVAISMPSARLCSSMWRLSVTVVVFVFALQCPAGRAQYLGSSCLTPERNSGTCVPVVQCNSIRALLSKPVLTANDVQYLESSRCGVLEKKVQVCCGAQSNGPTSTVTQPGQVPATVAVTVAPRISLEERAKLLPAECGIQYTDRIIGGERARIDEFPWTVLIQHRKRNGQLAFHCGGALISKRYVLTAAHCINSIARSWTITAVRLGEWDLQSENDCQTFFDEDVCSEPVQDIPVERIIVHPQYRATLSQVKNDIALIRLAQPARFNDFVQPICLPLSSEARTTSYDGKIVQVAGWGQTENVTQSQYKLFVSVKAVPEQICQQTYPGGAIDITQLCAGGEANKDSCRGDSGGALMFPEQSSAGPVMYIAGIVSYGRKCGLAGVPGVYTRVNQYLEWIIGNLDP